MRLICDVCWPPGGDGDVVSFSRYTDWVFHLLSPGHEQKMRANLTERLRKTEDDKGFVVTFAKSRQGTIPSRLELLHYFGANGCLAQFYYDETARFCFIRADSLYDGCLVLREGQYLVNDLHLVNCLHVKDTSDSYWKCLLQRKAPKQNPLPEVNDGPVNGLPLHNNGGGDQAVAEVPEQIMDTKTTKKKQKRNSPCLFDTRQLLENNQLTGIKSPNGAQIQNVDANRFPIKFTTSEANQSQQQQPMIKSPQNQQQQPQPMINSPQNHNMYRGQYPSGVAYYPPHVGRGQMIPPYLNPQHQQQQQHTFFPPMPNQHRYHDNYYRQMYPIPTPPPAPPSPSTPQTQMQQMRFNNFIPQPYIRQNYPTMHHPQIPGHPLLMQPSAPALLPASPPPPGFQPLQRVDPEEKESDGRKEETKSPLGVSFMSGSGDDEFLRKIEMAFGTAALGHLQAAGNSRSNVSVPTTANSSAPTNNLPDLSSSVSNLSLNSGRSAAAPLTSSVGQKQLIKSNANRPVPPDPSKNQDPHILRQQ